MTVSRVEDGVQYLAPVGTDPADLGSWTRSSAPVPISSFRAFCPYCRKVTRWIPCDCVGVEPGTADHCDECGEVRERMGPEAA